MESGGRPAYRTQPPPVPRTGVAPQGRVRQQAASRRRKFWSPGVSRALASGTRLCAGPTVFLLKCFAILVPLAALGVGLIYLRLLQGPISVGFIVGPVERGLSSELPEFSVKIEGAIVQLSERNALEFRLRNIRVADADGDVVAMAPLAGVSVSYRALLGARIAPARIEFIQPRVLVSRTHDGRLSLSFTQPGEGSAAQTASSDRALANNTRATASEPASRGVDLVKAIADASARARRRQDAASFLETVGFRDASVIYDAHGYRSVWKVPEFDVRVEHKQKRSIVSGMGMVASATGPWTFSMRAEESEKSQTIRLNATLQDLVPRGLVQGPVHFAMFDGIDMPISGEGGLEFARDGTVLNGHFAIDLEPGKLALPWLDRSTFPVGAGRLDVRYSGDKQRFDLGPATFSWGKSQAVIAGSVVHGSTLEKPVPGWQFDVRTLNGILAAEEDNVPPLAIDRWVARGQLGPDPGRLQLDEFQLDAGGAQMAMTGNIANSAGRIDALLEGRIGAMPVASMKALWPNAIAPRSREWVGRNLLTGALKGGTFRIATQREAGAGQSGSPEERRMSLSLEGADLEFATRQGLPHIEAPRALLRVEGNDAELTIPEASMAAGQGRRIALKSGRLFVSAIDSERPQAEISARAQASLGAVLDVLDREPLALVREAGLGLAGLDGKVEGQMRLTLPLGDAISTADMKVEGKARLTDGRAKAIFGSHDINGATVTFDVTENAMDVRGDMLLGGVSVKLGWQVLAGVRAAQQPPIKISATLDNSDRAQLKLDLNHMVQGEVPVEINVQRNGPDDTKIHFIADLTAAEVTLNDISWQKPSGRPAGLEFDVGKGQTYKTELQNFRLIGDNIAIDGWVGLGPDHHPVEYHFPHFSINVVTNIDVHGIMRPGRVWDVKARGKTYDAKELFQSLISFGQLSDRPAQATNRPGLDLVAEIDNVLGASDTTIRGVKLKMQKRAEQLTMLDMRGTLESGKTLTARLRPDAGRSRLLTAEAADAGQALKLIGFYSNMLGGTADLEINLDAKGAADRTGVLAIQNFRVLGDPIVSEVLQSPDEGRPAIEAGRKGARRVVREQFDFERLRAPFSMGNGQLVLENAHVTGPVVGATMRGKIDYRTQRLQLGGTYVPLSGFNRSFAPIPILGPLLTGPRGEGVLGITFAIEGPMADPQVIVNPLSLVMPGIFREIFQMTPENPKVTPRDDRASQPKAGVKTGPQVRASPPVDWTTQGGTKVQPEALGGWSAQTTPPPAKGK
ncbi:MAG: AsmA-like C-terminal region-containing protein [Hyphomicrobiaceae bacterium]